MTDYKNGTIATATVRGIPGIRVMRQQGDGHQRWICCDFPEGEGAGYLVAYDGEVDDVRPLVVLDLDLSAHVGVDRLVQDLRADNYRDLADQIEAQTKPPKPAEPTGLGAVVEDSKGVLWVRVTVNGASDCWKPNNSRDRRKVYADVDVVRVLSEGVQS